MYAVIRTGGKQYRVEEGETIEIANVLGQLSPNPVYGYVEFDRDGQTYRLLGLGEAEEVVVEAMARLQIVHGQERDLAVDGKKRHPIDSSSLPRLREEQS